LCRESATLQVWAVGTRHQSGMPRCKLQYKANSGRFRRVGQCPERGHALEDNSFRNMPESRATHTFIDNVAPDTMLRSTTPPEPFLGDRRVPHRYHEKSGQWIPGWGRC